MKRAQTLLVVLCLLTLPGCGRPAAFSGSLAATRSGATTRPTTALTLAASLPTPSVLAATLVPTAEPTLAPTMEATAEPTVAPASPPPSATPPTLPPGTIVLFTGNRLMTVAADGTTRPLVSGGRDSGYRARISPDGRWLALPTNDVRFEVVDLWSDTTFTISEPGLTIFYLAFAPDSSSLVFSQTSSADHSWRMRHLDLATGEMQDLMGSRAEDMVGVLDWQPSGMLATRVPPMGTDGGPGGLYLIDPTTLEMTTLRPVEDPYISATLSPNGRQLAIVEGRMGLGIERPAMGLSVLDIASGQRVELEPARDGAGYLSHLTWTLDSTRLIYRRQPFDGPPLTTFTLASADGSARQQIDLGHVVIDLAWADPMTMIFTDDGEPTDTLYRLSLGGAPVPLASFQHEQQETTGIVAVVR